MAQINNTKKPPQVDGTNYPYWKSKMTTHIKSINRKVWKVVHETCPYPFTHGKYAWASNMDSIEFYFISLCKGCHQLPKGGD